MPLPPSTYSPGPVSPQQLNRDLYGSPSIGPSGVLFHGRRPVLSESVMAGGTAYAALAQQAVAGAGVQAYSIIDTTALAGAGADQPGTASAFTFQNHVPSSGGTAGDTAGQWLTWGFPYTGLVTAPPGGVGAGMVQNSSFGNIGTFQYGNTAHNNCPYHLDLLAPGDGTANTWKPAFWWLTPSTPVIEGSSTDTAGQLTRMGFLWQSVGQGGGTVASVPSVAATWGTVTSAALNGMSTALTFLNNPPAFRATTTSGQSVPNATATIIGLRDVPGFDNYSGWSTAAANYTVPLTGLYLFSPTVVWGTASSQGLRYCGLQVLAGGTTVNYQGPSYAATPVGPGTTGTGLTSTAVARVLSLNAGDKVAAFGFQSSGGGNVSLYTGFQSRLIGAYMTQQAAAGTTLSYTAPVTGFRFQAGALSGTAITAAFNARIGNDVGFLLSRPYFTGFQQTPQSGFANGSGFHMVTIDSLGALPRGGNGDSYGGWSASNHWYTSQVAGWYLVIADLYATPPAATTATLTAGIFCSSSGGITPSATPDQYQQVFYPISTGGPPPGAFAMGMYYLQPGESVYPMLQAQNWGGTWGTFVNGGTTNAVYSQFSVFFISS